MVPDRRVWAVVAVVLGAGAVWIGVGRPTGVEPAPSGEAESIEQGRLAGTRLTRPFIEGAGVRDADPRLAGFRRRVEALVERGRTTDPTLRVSVYLRELETGAWTGLDEEAPYVPASLMKVAVLFHALDRLEADPTLAREMRVYPGPADMPSPDNLADADPARRMTPGAAYSFDELLERMVVFSDNHAKDLVMAGVAPSEVGALMARLGVPGRVDVDGRAVMTARAYAALFRLLYHSSYFSRERSEQALDLLRRADFGRGLRAGLPAGVVVASKYGVHFDPGDLDSGQQLHECGVVYAPETPFVLCVMTRSLLQPADGLARIVAGVADEAWRTLGPAPSSLGTDGDR